MIQLQAVGAVMQTNTHSGSLSERALYTQPTHDYYYCIQHFLFNSLTPILLNSDSAQTAVSQDTVISTGGSTGGALSISAFIQYSLSTK